MTNTFATCPSCQRPNKPEARYCINCGSIISPVYCSSCGTPNPEGLKQCVECGKPVPTLTSVRWNPIVTVLQPTSAMGPERRQFLEMGIEPEEVLGRSQRRESLARNHEKLRPSEY